MLSLSHMSTRWRLGTCAAATLLAVTSLSAGLESSGNASAATSSKERISIHLTVRDIEFPGKFWPNDELRLTVRVYVGGSPARQGVTYLTSNDPSEPELCNVGIPGGNYCNIDFPNPGRWTIVAKYGLVFSYPQRFSASSSLAVVIRKSAHKPPVHNPPPGQATQTSVFYTDTYINGSYYPLASATVSVVGQGSLSPEAGTVTFFDAQGGFICQATVDSAGTVECGGFSFPSPMPAPATGNYSGTNVGVNDGAGTVYAPSSGQS
jgi:hypothetical protein